MSDGAVPHRHDWGGMAFELDDDRPIAVQVCACGWRRTIRAWEAYWDPAGAPAAHPAGRTVAMRAAGHQAPGLHVVGATRTDDGLPAARRATPGEDAAAE